MLHAREPVMPAAPSMEGWHCDAAKLARLDLSRNQKDQKDGSTCLMVLVRLCAVRVLQASHGISTWMELAQTTAAWLPFLGHSMHACRGRSSCAPIVCRKRPRCGTFRWMGRGSFRAFAALPFLFYCHTKLTPESRVRGPHMAGGRPSASSGPLRCPGEARAGAKAGGAAHRRSTAARLSSWAQRSGISFLTASESASSRAEKRCAPTTQQS